MLDISRSVFSAKNRVIYAQEHVEKNQKWVPKAVGQTVGSFCDLPTPSSNQLM